MTLTGARLGLAVAILMQVGRPDPSLPRFISARPVALVSEHLDGTAFRIPQGLFYDASQDEVFVADSGNGLIGIFDGAGVPKFSFSTGSSMDYPVGIAVDAEGDIYVLKAGAREVAVFNYRGEPRRTIPLGEVERETVVASGMGIGPDGLLYVLDGAGGRILVYTRDGIPRRLIRGSGRGGSRLQAPYDLAFDATGDLYVTDRRGTPVQVYDVSGRYLRGWGKRDLGAMDFATPSGITVDPYGYVLVADPARQDIKVFSRDGEFQDRFGGFGQRPGQVAYPTDVVAGRGGRVYVIERVGGRLQAFDRISLGDGPKGAGAPHSPQAAREPRP